MKQNARDKRMEILEARLDLLTRESAAHLRRIGELQAVLDSTPLERRARRIATLLLPANRLNIAGVRS